MKLIYTCENQFLITNAKNIIDALGIETFIKNEFSTGAVGEISAFDCWPELWVVDDTDFETAALAIESMIKPKNTSTWVCLHCKEVNEPAFELCWKCQHDA
ncbi:DUF2007 domain-containing protein [Vibrio genomosp. F10]|uniref:RanBP2-type domain-containing protein n=1 Tax=Vibrio genomosp. F10 TaxID=723171 RepID=A0A1B9QXM4_9VIBR|nr:DUF2007 domain-containing protein [Vibrio genomosp. F10]OCH74689.1 hypothetical protein A6E14_12265 [Vibrio genomosp. F10]